jgi:hypothetical protein
MSTDAIAAEIRALPTTTTPELAASTIPNSYREMYAPGRVGVRTQHAFEALRNPDAVDSFEVGEVRIHLATRRIEAARPFTMVLELQQWGPGDGVMLTGGWRDYQSEPGARPVDLFAGLIDRFALLVRVGGLVDTQFVVQLTIPGFAGNATDVIDIRDQTVVNPVAMSSLMRVDSLGGDVHVKWVYAFDVGRYRQETQRHA